MNETVFQYQTKAEPPRQPAVVTVTQPWMLLDPPRARPRLTSSDGVFLSALVEAVGAPLLPPPPLPLARVPLRLEAFAPALIALPYDRPLMDHSPIVVRRVYMKLEAEAHPLAPGQYDLPLPTPWRDPIARPRVPIPTQTAEWGRSDITTVAWIAPANQPVRPPRPRQSPTAAAQNLVPIVPPAAPANSWGPSAEIPMRRRRFFGLWQSLGQEVTPITSTVTLVSSWINLPPMPRRRAGLPAPQQQAYSGPPPAIEVIIQDAPWRPVFPDWLRRPRWLWSLLHLPGPPNQRTVAAGIGCIMVDQPGLAMPLLLSPCVESSTLIDPMLTASSLQGPELC